LVTIFVLATKTDVQPNFVSGGHLFALDQKNEREDKISCAFHANGSEIRYYLRFMRSFRQIRPDTHELWPMALAPG